MKRGNNASGFDLALNFISYQSRTVKEVREYLNTKSFSKSDAEEIVQKLIYYNYLNDKKYLTEKIENNRYGKQYGPLKLKQMMVKKGINSELLSDFDSHFTEMIEKECFNAQWEKANKKYAHELPLKRKQKISAYLQRHGFSISMINEKIFNVMLEESETQQDPEEDIRQLEYFYSKYYRMQSQKGYTGWE